jgi:hypothetical protein
MAAKKKLKNLTGKSAGTRAANVKGGSIIKKRDELQMSILRKM